MIQHLDTEGYGLIPAIAMSHDEAIEIILPGRASLIICGDGEVMTQAAGRIQTIREGEHK